MNYDKGKIMESKVPYQKYLCQEKLVMIFKVFAYASLATFLRPYKCLFLSLSCDENTVYSQISHREEDQREKKVKIKDQHRDNVFVVTIRLRHLLPRTFRDFPRISGLPRLSLHLLSSDANPVHAHR